MHRLLCQSLVRVAARAAPVVARTSFSRLSTLSFTRSPVFRQFSSEAATNSDSAATQKSEESKSVEQQFQDDSIERPDDFPRVVGVAGKLALSLFDDFQATVEADTDEAEQAFLDQLYQANEELNAFNVILEDGTFQDQMYIPGSTAKDREAIMNQAFEIAEIKSPIVKNFLNHLLEINDFGRFKKIMAEFEKLVNYEIGLVSATITSATPLSPEQVQRITAVLEARAGEGFQVEVEQIIDPEVLGGFVVTMDDSRLDLSAANTISYLQTQLK